MQQQQPSQAVIAFRTMVQARKWQVQRTAMLKLEIEPTPPIAHQLPPNLTAPAVRSPLVDARPELLRDRHLVHKVCATLSLYVVI
jgi:hypothetical protein